MWFTMFVNRQVRRHSLRKTWSFLLLGLVSPLLLADTESAALTQQVFATERAFAKTMAERNREAFADFLADEAVFFSRTGVLRGKAQVAAGWSGFFDGVQAPFSWEPDQVEVLASGSLAMSSGPVRDPDGKIIARFNSIWRLEAPGQWRIVFDKGSPPESERE